LPGVKRLDTPARHVKVAGVDLTADEGVAEAEGGDGRGSAAHIGVEDGQVCQRAHLVDAPAHEFDGFLADEDAGEGAGLVAFGGA